MKNLSVLILLIISFVLINDISYSQDKYFSYDQHYWDVTALTDFEHGAGVQLNYNSPKAIGGYLTLMSEKVMDQSLTEFNRTINIGVTFSSKFGDSFPNMVTFYTGAAFSQIQTFEGPQDEVGLNIGMKSTSTSDDALFGINLLAGITIVQSTMALEIGIGATF
nr:hypothetical protein 12 [Balneolaceae bacterium]